MVECVWLPGVSAPARFARAKPGGGAAGSGLGRKCVMIRLLPKDVPAFLRRLKHYVWLVTLLQGAVLFAASEFWSEDLLGPVVTLFGIPMCPLDLAGYQVGLFSLVYACNQHLLYRFLIWVVCPMCLARLVFQPVKNQLTCGKCGDCYDCNTLERRVPTEPSTSAPAS